MRTAKVLGKLLLLGIVGALSYLVLGVIFALVLGVMFGAILAIILTLVIEAVFAVKVLKWK